MQPNIIDGALLVLVPALALATCVFWVCMIVECATKERADGDKLVWIVIIVLAGWIGAFLYYFVRRPRRIAQFGA